MTATFPARIGHLTSGQIRSIALHEADETTGELLARYLTEPDDIANVIRYGDIQRITPNAARTAINPLGATALYIAYQPGGARPIDHADNAWPLGAQCLYLHQQDTWWKRTANTDGTWPDTWTPIT
jgi:hypothetical protein